MKDTEEEVLGPLDWLILPSMNISWTLALHTDDSSWPHRTMGPAAPGLIFC